MNPFDSKGTARPVLGAGWVVLHECVQNDYRLRPIGRGQAACLQLANLSTCTQEAVLGRLFLCLCPLPSLSMPQRVPFRPKQSLGQNFMHDPNMVRKIVGALQAPSGAHVVEVGAGTGALTEELQRRYDRLTVVEIDERAVDVLRERFPDLDVREQDMLTFDWAALADEKGGPHHEGMARKGSLHVISNTPYNLTSQLLFALLDAREHVAEAVLTMQKEVAERIVATPRTKAYGILSVIMQLYAHPELLFTVSRHVFYPQPDVTSACVRFTYNPPGEEGFDVDPDWLRTLVRSAFNQRRKMLRNSLSAWTKDRGIELPNDWGRRRPESLAPADFVELAQYLDAQIHDA